MTSPKDFEIFRGADNNLKLIVYNSAYYAKKLNNFLGKPYDGKITSEDEPIFSIPENQVTQVFKLLKVKVKESKQILKDLKSTN